MNLLHHSPLSHFHSISDKKYLFEYLSSSSGFETTTTTNHSWNLKVRRLDCFISLVTWLVSGDEQNSVDENINITLYVFGIVRHTRYTSWNFVQRLLQFPRTDTQFVCCNAQFFCPHNRKIYRKIWQFWKLFVFFTSLRNSSLAIFHRHKKKEHSKFDDICFIKFQLLITWQPNHGTKEEWEKGNE